MALFLLILWWLASDKRARGKLWMYGTTVGATVDDLEHEV
jgi:hypothetical protein